MKDKDKELVKVKAELLDAEKLTDQNREAFHRACYDLIAARAQLAKEKAARERDAAMGWSGIQQCRAKLCVFLAEECGWNREGLETPEEGVIAHVGDLRQQLAQGAESQDREKQESERLRGYLLRIAEAAHANKSSMSELESVDAICAQLEARKDWAPMLTVEELAERASRWLETTQAEGDEVPSLVRAIVAAQQAKRERATGGEG